MVKKRRLSPKTLKFRRKVCFFSLLIIVLTVGVTLSVTVLFKVDSIDVIGSSVYSKEEILTASGARKGVNLFLFNSKKAGNNIKKLLPFVDDVKITKRFPCDLKIETSNAKVAGAIQMPEGFIIVSNKQKILEKVSECPENVCLIRGVSLENPDLGEQVYIKDETIKNVLNELISLIEAYSMDVNVIDVSNVSHVFIRYEDRINILLGIPEKLEYKIKTASHILQNKIKKEESGTLDLSLVLENDHSYFAPCE